MMYPVGLKNDRTGSYTEADPPDEIPHRELDFENIPEIIPCAKKALGMLKIVDHFPYSESLYPHYKSFEYMVEAFRRIIKKVLALYIESKGEERELHEHSMDTIGYHAHLVNEGREKLGLTKFIELTDIWEEYKEAA